MYCFYESGGNHLHECTQYGNDTLSRHERFEDLPVELKEVLYFDYLYRGYRITFDNYCKMMRCSLVDPLTQEITPVH